jgi:zinc protease
MNGFERLITAGEYHQEQVESWQKNQKLRLESKSEQQSLEFRRQFFNGLYGPEHPYTVTGIETAAAVDKVHKDALDSYRRSHYVAGTATLIVVGDFDPADAESIIRNTFGGWSKKGDAPAAMPKAATPNGPVVIGVVGRELPQLEMQIGFATGNGVDGQEAARRVLAEMMNIRVGDVRFKLGSTYGLYARHAVHRGPGAYVIAGGGVDAERAGESIKAIQDGLDMLRKGEHFDDDFVRARRKVLSELLGVSTVTSELADRISYVGVYGLPPTYYNTLLQEVAAVSTAQIHALIAQELDPNKEVMVVLGDKPHLEKAFADAGLKDTKIVEPDYK